MTWIRTLSLSGTTGSPIEDYALAFRSPNWSTHCPEREHDWLSIPRFASASVHAALPGTEEHGRWLIAPSESDVIVADRRYVHSTFILKPLR